MRMNRLFETVYLLIARGNITAAELAARFQVSTRTVYRDIDLLSGAGIPVYASKGKGGGIRLLPGFVLDKSFLTVAEQSEILFALQSLKATNAQDGEEVLDRLSSLFHKDGGDWIDVDFSHWGSGPEEREKFRVLKQGILECLVTEFTYCSSYGQKTRRRVEPVKLCFKSGGWYLQAYCLEKQEFRTFKICRMEEVALTQAPFRRRQAPPELEDTVDPDRLVHLKLWFPPEAAFRVYDEFDRTAIQRCSDGGFQVEVWFPEDNWVYSYLLSFRDQVWVLSPDYVRHELKKQAFKIIENCKKKREYDI